MRRIKRERWEAFIAPYRAIADPDSICLDEFYAWCIITRPHFARLHRVRTQQRTREYRRHRNDRFFPHDYGWLRRDYGRKQRRNR